MPPALGPHVAHPNPQLAHHLSEQKTPQITARLPAFWLCQPKGSQGIQPDLGPPLPTVSGSDRRVWKKVQMKGPCFKRAEAHALKVSPDKRNLLHAKALKVPPGS